MRQEKIRYDDTQRLQHVCTSEGWSRWGPEREVSEADIRAFADLTGNHQWIHDDPVRCEKESPYGGLIAHGLYLVTLIPGLLPQEYFRIVGNSVRIVRGFDRLRLPSPVYAGERVHVRTQVLKASVAPSGKGIVIMREVELWSLNGKKPAVSGVLKLQYF